ncbi:MAG: hypothetical protein CVT49_10685 [candidate division Zixibacteria bacterium HGW-Zixibacteria-1]|nr:MAG: hypothetical protein CVT49_10685 [candidate division Zixibacteria bacterium HGW-Zixibacteria-1]
MPKASGIFSLLTNFNCYLILTKGAESVKRKAEDIVPEWNQWILNKKTITGSFDFWLDIDVAYN